MLILMSAVIFLMFLKTKNKFRLESNSCPPLPPCKKVAKMWFNKGSKFKFSVQLLKHFKHEYKFPKIKDVETNNDRNYVKEKFSTSHNSMFYILKVSDFSVLKKNIDIIMELFSESFDMLVNHKDKILKIDYGKGNVLSDKENINGDRLQCEVLAEKYLNPNYSYDLK